MVRKTITDQEAEDLKHCIAELLLFVDKFDFDCIHAAMMHIVTNSMLCSGVPVSAIASSLERYASDLRKSQA